MNSHVKLIFNILINLTLVEIYYGKQYFNKNLYKHDEYDINISLNILRNCFDKQDKLTVIIGNLLHYKGDSFRHLHTSQIISFSAVNKSDNLQKYIGKEVQYKIDPNSTMFKPIPADKFIILDCNLTSFDFSLFELKHSIWWRAESFFIIDNTIQTNSCRYSADYIRIAWEFNILSCVFLCQDEHSSIYLYSFNPYTAYAPLEWTKFESYKQVNGHPLIIFKRKYNAVDTTGICTNLNYDKTRTLSKYIINLCVSNLFYEPNIPSVYKIRGNLGEIMEAIWTSLDVKINLTVVYGNGILDKNGTPTEELADVLNGIFDMNTVYDFQRDIWKYELNSFIMSGICYISKKEMITISDHLANMLSFTFTSLVLGIYVVTTLSLAYFFKINISWVIIDVLRAFVGASMILDPKLMSKRTIFIWFIIIFMGLSSYLQTTLTSLITGEPFRNEKIESINDLIVYGYTVCVDEYGRQYYQYSPFYDKLVSCDSADECWTLLQRRTKMAWSWNCDLARIYYGNDSQIRISVDNNMQNYFVFTFRVDFPLRTRLFQIYYRLFESGIAKYINDRFVLYKKNYQVSSQDQIINLNQLNSIFRLYIISHCFAVVVFIIEYFSLTAINLNNL